MAAKALPFDERNQRDFDDMTARIRDALDLIRKNKSLRATQDALAEFAQCSRRTLSLRVWPILELKKIKEARSSHLKAVEGKPDVRTAVKTSSLLIKQVKNYQTQNGELFDRLQDLEEDKARLVVVVSTLEHQLQALKEKLNSLEREARRVKLRAL
jgi:hypothetical protein